MKKIHWTRATGLAAALFLTAGLSPLSAQGLLNSPGGGAAGAAGGHGAGAAGAGGTRAGLGSRLDVNSSVRGVNPAQAVRGATSAGAGLGGGARAQAGLGAGANAPGAGLRGRGAIQGQGAAQGRTGLFSNSTADAGAGADAGIEADVSTSASMDRREVSGREHAGRQAEMTLNHRLAEIDRLRDQALATGNTVQLAKADELEAQARTTFQHRLDVIRTAPDHEQAPPEAPRDIRSRIRAGMDGRAAAGTPALPEGAGADFAGDAAEATDIAVQRPEEFGRMRQRSTAAAGGRAESRGLLQSAPRGGAAGATPNAASNANTRFAADANPRGPIDASSNAALESQVHAEESAASRVRPVANSRFASDLQSQGALSGGNSARGGMVSGDVRRDALLDTRDSAQRTRQEIEQVDYSATSGLDASGRAAGRASSATYADSDGAYRNVPRAPQGTRAELNGAARGGQTGWEGIEDAGFRSDLRPESQARFNMDRGAGGALNGAGGAASRLDTRTDLPRQPAGDEAFPPAEPRFGGRAAADVDAGGTVRRSDDVYSASSNVRGRAATSASNSSPRSRSPFDAPAGANRRPVNPDESGGRAN